MRQVGFLSCFRSRCVTASDLPPRRSSRNSKLFRPGSILLSKTQAAQVGGGHVRNLLGDGTRLNFVLICFRSIKLHPLSVVKHQDPLRKAEITTLSLTAAASLLRVESEELLYHITPFN